jgi:hypothetical protein
MFSYPSGNVNADPLPIVRGGPAWRTVPVLA